LERYSSGVRQIEEVPDEVWIMTWSEVTRPGKRFAWMFTPAIDVAEAFEASEMKMVHIERACPSLRGYWAREK
jgi:hypothetical protein